MSIPGSEICTPDWLTLRETADAAARADGLATDLAGLLPPEPRVLDLGCGTGSMSRWLAPRLATGSHWVLADRDPVVLAHAVDDLPRGTTGEARAADITTLTADDLADVDLVTASALLDLLTADEVARLADACVAARRPALLTLSVSGEVRFEPGEPRDAVIADAFDAHQRRAVGGRRLLGPDSGAAAATAFEQRGARVQTVPSPWRLDCAAPGDAALVAEWLHGWVGAALLHDPALGRRAEDYLERRLAAAAAGRLRVTVGHVDVLALPGTDGTAGATDLRDAGARS